MEAHAEQMGGRARDAHLPYQFSIVAEHVKLSGSVDRPGGIETKRGDVNVAIRSNSQALGAG